MLPARPPPGAAPASARPLPLSRLVLFLYTVLVVLDCPAQSGSNMRNTCNFADPGITLWSPDVYAPGRRRARGRARLRHAARPRGIRRR